MKRPLKTVLKYFKKHGARVFLVVLGFAVLLALLQLQVFKKIEQDYQRNTAHLLYAPAPENSPVANIYLDGTQGAKALMAELTDLVAQIKKKSPEELFVVIDPKELKTCKQLSANFQGVTFIFKNADLDKDCLVHFRKQNISFLGLENFSLDLGKGEHIYVKDAASEIYNQFAEVSNSNLQMNMALAFTRIPQIDGREILKSGTKKIMSHGLHIVSLKNKTIFVGFNTQTFKKGMEQYIGAGIRSSDKPYTLKSETLSEDFKLSNLYFHLQEDAFLKSTSAGLQYVLWALIYLQVLFAILYFGPMMSVLTVSAVGLEVLVLTAVIPTVFNFNVPMSYGLIAIVYATIFAQSLKRHEQDKVIKRTQRLLNARSQFNRQILENQKIQAPRVSKDSQLHTDFDKYFTQLNVVDSIHGVVIPDITEAGNASKDISIADKSLKEVTTESVTPKISNEVQQVFKNINLNLNANKKITETTSSLQKPKKIFFNVDVKQNADQPKTQFKILKDTHAVPQTKDTESDVINSKSKIAAKSEIKIANNKPGIGDADKPETKGGNKIETKVAIHTNPPPSSKSEVRFSMIHRPKVTGAKKAASATNISTKVPTTSAEAVPTMVLNFKNLFANNLKRKNLNFEVLGTLKASTIETQNQDSKKKELFFEALCIQVINDSIEGSSIEFSSHDKDEYVIYILTHKSMKQFNYKQWLKNAAFFEGIASDLKKQGIIIYQNCNAESEYHDLAIGFKKISSQATKVA